MAEQKEIMMILTENCNLNCTYCFESHKSNKRMNFAVAKEIIDRELDSNDGVEEIRFTMFGGEPLLEYNLIKKIYGYIKEKMKNCSKKVLIFIDTNGTLMDEEKKQWFKDRKEYIHCGLSLDGNKKMHDMNRSNSFDKLDLNYYKECWPNQSVKMTISKETLPFLADGIKFIHSLGYVCGASFAYGIQWLDELRVILDEQLNILIEYYVENDEIELCQLLNMDLTSVTKDKSNFHKRCAAGKYVKAYDTQGNAYPCHTFSPMGIGEKAKDFINYTLPITDIHEKEKCVECIYHYICPTCYGANYIYTGDWSNRSEGLCMLFKRCVVAAAIIKLRRIGKKKSEDLTQEDFLVLNAISIIMEAE